MKPASPTPHDPLDELLAAALHGELTDAQRAELDALLQHDPAARAAYQETQAMHDLLERNHREAQPDAAFEERLISGVRQKTREEKNRETPWESAVFLWRGLGALLRRPSWKAYVGAAAIVLILAGVAMGPITNGIKREKAPYVTGLESKLADNTTAAQPLLARSGGIFRTKQALDEQQARATTAKAAKQDFASTFEPNASPATLAATPRRVPLVDNDAPLAADSSAAEASFAVPITGQNIAPLRPTAKAIEAQSAVQIDARRQSNERNFEYDAPSERVMADAKPMPAASGAPFISDSDKLASANVSGVSVAVTPQSTASTNQPSRKLVRDAQLDLEVKDYQPTVDAITALAKANGGYLDSSNSQRGGNGKLQGSVVAKVLPENLDAFLLKLRGLGEIKNQSVSTEDVTKDYYDTQARLANSRLMETQLQQLLTHDNGKVADLLKVEREIERVRGDIEQMQGQLKLYDFQVQYATVTINVAEKDLHQAAAYLLRENDQFSLFTGNVEDAFAQAKAAADTFKAEILNADLQHDSDNHLSATLVFSVPPDQIDGFLAKVKSLGRVDNFTRQTQRVANDGGDPGDPSDQTRTEKDHVQVQLTIRADDESPRQQTQLAIASTGDIDAQAQALKDDAVKEDVTVTASNFERATDGTETAALSFRLPLAKVGDFMPVLQKLGRVESLTVERHDRPDQAAADPGAPAEIDLRLHNLPAVRFEDETPRQQTQLAVASKGDVDAQAQQIKSDALQAGYTLTASTFNRSPDGTEQAAITFRLPLTQAAAFTTTLEKLGRVESLAVQRNDVTGPNSIDPNAPAEISFDLHSEPAVVAENHNFAATLRSTFGGAVAAFLGSFQVIGILMAYLVPWVCVLALLGWSGRRAYVIYRAKRAA